ncbi:MAG: type 1 glutamine amidotransferase [Candidatus Dormibacteria bacterium]|jgi:GMP synthase-like glutamine amidotransferase
MSEPAVEGSRPPLLVVIEHAEDEGPGLIGEIATGFGMQVRRLSAVDPLPALDGVTALVVMGGPQSVHEPDRRLRDEVVLLHEAVTRGLPVLGVCLGAQLAAAACGAPVRPGSRGPELGLGAVTLTAPGRDDPVFAGCGPTLAVLHWHADTFDLPRGSCHLAHSEAYPNQAFRLGRAYGFQFHVEVDGALLSAWARHLPLPDDAREWLRRTDAERRGVVARWLRQALDAVP